MSLLSTTSRRSFATIVVATYMEGFLLSRAAYARIVHEYPDFRRYIQAVARLRLKREAAHASAHASTHASERGAVATDTRDTGRMLELPEPGRAGIVLLEKLEGATSFSNGSAPQAAAAALPLTKQDRAGSWRTTNPIQP